MRTRKNLMRVTSMRALLTRALQHVVTSHFFAARVAEQGPLRDAG